VAYQRGEPGPGAAGDRAWVGAAVLEYPRRVLIDAAVVPHVAGAAYDAGRLALREGPGLEAAVRALAIRPDVLLVDATGRDHPRGAGLALHLGAVLDVPTIGVTHRPLQARGAWPPPVAGASSPVWLGDRVVGAWVRTQDARPVVVHAAWRVDADTARRVVMATVGRARTPEPLRQARIAARRARGEREVHQPTATD
jgi:deoxyribonuclease V